ncbi:unnamed protein product [Blepharisma stoltei]|uniref:Cyclin-dependent kinases regulatory subunit n=1 Tax=Blepharisma stoltei TaxID=1481888 RepID=A0AAU9JZD0_9CILI|nr:unnamed protein product [Blepharisma stoltei]
MIKVIKEKEDKENDKIEYSEKYYDSVWEYRQVIFPKKKGKEFRKRGLLSEDEWRSEGVQMTKGWQHYGAHPPEPHVLLFRRPIGTDPQTGIADPRLAEHQYREFEYKRHMPRFQNVAFYNN